VHRDLKPENLLFRTPEDNADLLIADFGLSRIMDEEQFHVLTTTCGTPGYMAPEIFKKSGHGKPVDLWAIGVITYFLLCGYTPFDRDSNLEEMQAILAADYSFTPLEYWRNVSLNARQFIKRCLTIDPTQRITAHEALSHHWIAGPESGRTEEDLLPTVKKNFNARRTLHKAIDTVRAINQLRAGGMGMMDGLLSKPPQRQQQQQQQQVPAEQQPKEEGNVSGEGQIPQDVEMRDADAGVNGGAKVDSMDPRGHGRGQTEAQIAEQRRRIEEAQRGMWQSQNAQAA